MTLTPEDEAFAATLGSGEDGRLSVEQLARGVRLKSTSWVGVVRFSTFEVQVVPKLSGDNLGLVRLLEYVTGAGMLRRQATRTGLDAAGSDLLELIAALLCDECERVLRRGVVRDYVERWDDAMVVRGRIDLANYAIAECTRPGRVPSYYDDHESAIPENRLLSTALDAGRQYLRDDELRNRANRVQAMFGDVCQPGPPLDVLRTPIEYNRLNDHYREGHHLARLLLHGLGFEELYRQGTTGCFAFLLDMNALFEQFVWKACEQLLRGRPFRVAYQYSDSSVIFDLKARRPYARIIPDVLVQALPDCTRRLPIDAKYKLYDERRLSSSDMYQALLYSLAFGHSSGDAKTRRALVFYPATASRGPLHLEIRSARGAEAYVSAIPCAIPRLLDELIAHEPGPAAMALVGAITEALN